MDITINVKNLLSKLKDFNPDFDLTGVKAYLFDLVVDSNSTDSTSFVKTKTLVYGDTVYPEEEEKAGSFTPPQETLPPGIIGDFQSQRRTQVSPERSGPTIKINRNSKPDRESKASRLEGIKRMTEMSSKDLVKELTKDFERKSDGNQFVDEGFESSSTGDIEIG